MNLKNKFKAVHRGELSAKLLRKCAIKTKLIGKKFKTPKEINFTYQNYFTNEINGDLSFLEIVPDFSNYNLMGEKYNLFIYEFEDNSKSPKWFDLELPKDIDVKIIWEINRLQFLPTMAVDFLKTKDTKILNRITSIIKEWDSKNPYDVGINWYSNLEVAIRSISLLLTYILLYDHIKSKEIEELIFKHGYHVYKDINYTEKCIPNNHLIGETTALYILGNIFESPESKKWINKSKVILIDYLEHLRDDGTYREASLSYHRFVLQMYLLVYLFAIKFQDNFIENPLTNKLVKAYIFLKSIEKPDGSFPQFGDWDDGVYYKLNNEPIENYKYFVDTLGYIVGNNDEKNLEVEILEQLFGNIKIEESYKNNFNDFNNVYRLFEIGKYGVYKDNNIYLFINNQEQIFHSHADGLSIELSLNGKNILIDSGTYNYNLDKELRQYFRSTRAHNTVYLGLDQSTQIGSFRWIDQPKTYLKKLEDTIGFEGAIKYKNKSTHKRKVIIGNNIINIEDEVYSKRNYIELNFHFSTERQIQLIGKNQIEIDREIKLQLMSDKEFDTKLEESYYSPSYNKIQKRKNLKIISKNENQKFLTKIQF
jgi:hypothetical protein